MTGTMRILLVATVYAPTGGNPWLLDDLAAALARAGHEVDVIVADPRTGRPRGAVPDQPPGVRAWSVGPRTRRGGPWGAAVAHASTALGLLTAARSIRSERYDLGIFTSVAAFNYGLPERLRRRGIIRHLVLVLWDFFPVHQFEIGRIRGRVLAEPLRRWERRSVRAADTVAVMSPANERFLDAYHPGAARAVAIIPPWSSAGLELPVRTTTTGLHAVFGGQLTAGRGLDTLVEAARLLDSRGSAVHVTVAGDGPDRERLVAASAGLSTLDFVGQLPRAEYRSLLESADVGIAITVPGVSVPSFPSKIAEYCGMGLPLVVAVEHGSDAGDIVESEGAGIAVPAGDAPALCAALEKLGAEKEGGVLDRRGAAARALYQARLSVDRAAERLAGLASSSRS
jgi:glycosyltransferase involved in cell wall biosynthesis